MAPLMLALALAPATAAADTKSCIASHASAQRETKAGHPKQAAQLYTACGSDNTCPEQLRSECAELLDQVNHTVPSVIFSAIDGKSSDVSNVKVYADEALLIDGLDGRAIELEPGKYHFRFVFPDNSSLSNDVLIREGEKNRLIEVRAPLEKKVEPVAPGVVRPAPIESAPPPPPPPPAEKSTPVGAWVATGVAVVGFGTFGTFALLGSSDKKTLQDCSPSCPDSAHGTRDSLKTKFLVADIGLGVGAASAILAGVLFLTSGPSAAEQRAQAANRGLSFNASAHGGELLLRGQF
ncbi:MAG: hypothetical protein ABIQ16_04505 [Polyangiaceae bacterium]